MLTFKAYSANLHFFNIEHFLPFHTLVLLLLCLAISIDSHFSYTDSTFLFTVLPSAYKIHVCEFLGVLSNRGSIKYWIKTIFFFNLTSARKCAGQLRKQ